MSKGWWLPVGDVLVYVELGQDAASPERLLGWARPLAEATGGRLVAVAAGESLHDAEGLDAADLVLEVSHPALARYLPEAQAEALVAAIEWCEPSLIVLENTTAGIDLAATVAARADLPLVGYCTEVTPDGEQLRSLSEVYGGRLLATSLTPLPAIVAVNSAVFADQPVAPGVGERMQLTPPAALDALRTAFVEEIVPDDIGLDLTKAKRLVCVGRGIGGAGNLSVAEELAASLDAEVGASRPVVDAGWAPKVRQVGKSGMRVKPKLYLALGVSGAPEHVEGMRNSELIIAVNTDPDAAIFNVAHYGAVADLFDIAEEMQKLLT